MTFGSEWTMFLKNGNLERVYFVERNFILKYLKTTPLIQNWLKIQINFLFRNIQELNRTDFHVFGGSAVDSDLEIPNNLGDGSFDLHVRKSHSGADSRTISEGNQHAPVFEGLHATVFGIEAFWVELFGVGEVF